jgi:hypothetical protein
MYFGLPTGFDLSSCLPFLDFDEGPKPAIEHGDALPGSGDVYVDGGLRRDLGDDSVLIDQLVPFPFKPKRRAVVPDPLELDGEVEIVFPRRRGMAIARIFLFEKNGGLMYGFPDI